MNFLQRLMYGRYGGDQLNFFLLGAYLVLSLLSAVIRFALLRWVGLILLALVFYRMMSRSITRRRAENAKFLALIRPVTQWLRLRRTIHKDQEHLYLKCPNCGQNLRVPRGKGRINVTCRSCGSSFEAKS